MREMTVENEADIIILGNLVKALLPEKKKLSVSIKPFHEGIRDKQRGLYFIWCDEIGSDIGETKQDTHLILKEQFLLAIFIHSVDNPEHDGLRESWENLQHIMINAPEYYPGSYKTLLRGVSIMLASVDEMREYLNEIDRLATQTLGIRLTRPDDKYWAAMGIKPPKKEKK